MGLLETPLHPSLGPPGHAGTAFPTISITTTPADPVLLEKMDPLPCMPGFQCHFSLERITAAPVPLPLASPVPPPPHPHASGREDHQPTPQAASPYLCHSRTPLDIPCPISKLLCLGLPRGAGSGVPPGLSLDPTAWRVRSNSAAGCQRGPSSPWLI